MNKHDSWLRAIEHCQCFLAFNNLEAPSFVDISGRRVPRAGRYGYYRDSTVHVHVTNTRPPTRTPGFAWSYPGFKADLTVLGVTAHEVGHHVDQLTTARRSDRLRALEILRRFEHPVSGYEPDKEETFAEAARLFITNPDLLRSGRPMRWELLTTLGLRPIVHQTWREVLAEAHPRILAAAESWVKKG